MAHLDLQTVSAQADALEETMSRELDDMIVSSVLYSSGDIDPTVPRARPTEAATFASRRKGLD